MLNLKIFFIISASLNFTYSQNISQIKCDEYATIVLKPDRINTHLTNIRKTFSFGLSMKCLGVLISDQYLLTSGGCGNDLFVNLSQAIFENGYNTITDTFTYYLKENEDYRNNVVLLKLREKIDFDLGQHRPACLWLYNSVPEYQYIYLSSNAILDRQKYLEPVEVFGDNICRKYDNIYDEKKFCFHAFNRTMPDFEPWEGSPILYHFNYYDLFYLTGVYTNRNNDLLSGVQLNAQHIEWIESVVWKEYKESLLSCGELKVQHIPYITYGSSTYQGQYPWHVAVYRRKEYGTKQYICGGTIINNQTVLTAAHCVADEDGVISPDSLTVGLGKYDLNIFSQNSYEIQVQAVIPHEKFNIKILENDIAILKLKIFITFTNFIQPICITNNTEIYEENYGIGIVPGWGRDENNYPTNLLYQASLPIRTNADCRESNRNFFPNYLNENNFCAGYQNGTNVCIGDSGGGMIFKKSGRWYIKGIVSLGVALPMEQRCDISELVLFTDVTKFYDWIMLKA